MKFLLFSSPQTSVFGPSSIFSVVAHVVLIGASVYGTGVRARRLEESITQRVQYLPPPDRARPSAPAAEHLQYIDIGAPMAAMGVEKPDGRDPRLGGFDPAQRPTGLPGDEAFSQTAAPPVESTDSVYSFLEVDEQAVRVEGSAAPAYPVDLLKSGMEGRVFARYVIDTAGHADSNEIEILRSTHVGFALAVREAIPQMRFKPAVVRGARVRQAVEQSFEFRITPPAAPAPAEHTRTNPVP
jgi:TonB family protein